MPLEYQSRALTWGIIGAVAMRGVMIFVGVAAIQRFRWVVLLFAGILLGSAFKLLFEGHADGRWVGGWVGCLFLSLLVCSHSFSMSLSLPTHPPTHPPDVQSTRT